MFCLTKKRTLAVVFFSLLLTACSQSSNRNVPVTKSVGKTKLYQTAQPVSLSDQQAVLAKLSAQEQAWRGTRYRIGGTSKKGVDCSGFMQVTFKELFGISLPRMTVDQAKVGRKVAKSELKAGDLVFFNTGRGPNGKHVGVYNANGQFLHASTRGGVIYSSLTSPYWSKTYWQARRL